MKVKITIILSLILSLSAFSKEVGICKSTGLPEIAGNEVKSIMNTMKVLSDDEIFKIKSKLCIEIAMADTTGFSKERFTRHIFDGLGVSPNAKNANKIISTFLNENKNKLICSKNPDDKFSRELHLYKSALLNGVLLLFDEILMNDDVYEIDFNGYEMVDGKKETVIDYLDKLIVKERTSDLVTLREDIIDMGGKRGAEL